ncbi:MAG TPA: hypothetical protein VNS81_02080 [Nocardioides sp.]|nr:hypothetical protein [Nocardioides sp.]
MGIATDDVVRELVLLACHAPSVHNTQPWLWEHHAGRLTLRADLARQLPVEDPDGRNLVISCGAALHHLQFAAKALGWDATVWRVPDPADPSLLAHVDLAPREGHGVSETDVELLRSRCTDRRTFTSWAVPDARLQLLCEHAERWGALAQAVTDTSSLVMLELAASRALDVADKAGPRRQEQQHWVGRQGDDGMPASVLAEGAFPGAARSRFGSRADQTRPALASGDGVIALGGAADDPLGWLRTGEGLSALWLEATRLGLSVVPMSLPLEVPDTRREVEVAVVSGAFRPHLLLQVGWQPIGSEDRPRTPRRLVKTVLSSP